MNLRVRENPWRLMLAVNAAVPMGVFLYKIAREPYVPYIHLWSTIISFYKTRADRRGWYRCFSQKFRVWLVFALSGAVWLITFGLFVKAVFVERLASTMFTCRCSCSWPARHSF